MENNSVELHKRPRGSARYRNTTGFFFLKGAEKWISVYSEKHLGAAQSFFFWKGVSSCEESQCMLVET